MAISQREGETRIERKAEAKIARNAIAWIDAAHKSPADILVHIFGNVPKVRHAAVDHARI
jgi:hypothetical protein